MLLPFLVALIINRSSEIFELISSRYLPLARFTTSIEATGASSVPSFSTTVGVEVRVGVGVGVGEEVATLVADVVGVGVGVGEEVATLVADVVGVGVGVGVDTATGVAVLQPGR